MSRTLPPGWDGPSIRPGLRDLREFRDRPHRFLLDLAREHGEVCWIGAGPVKFAFATGPEHIRHVLIEGHRVYRKNTFQYRLLEEITGDGLLVSDGEVWRERRRIQQPAFHRRTLPRTAEVTARQTAAMLGRWRAEYGPGRPVAIDREMFELALLIVMETLFGYAATDRAPALVAATVDVLDYLVRQSRTLPIVPRWLRPGRAGFRRALAVLDDAIGDIIAERRRRPAAAEDLLSSLLAAEGEGLAADAVRNEMITMIIAGHETVASALTWTWHLLSERPDLDQALAAEAADRLPADATHGTPDLPLTSAIFTEALRLYPPAWVISRKATASTEPGSWLPPGTMVMLSPFVTQRLARYWPDPDTFDPSRFRDRPPSDAYFPFGTGPRLCIGRDFALVEAVIILAMVAREYRFHPASSPVEEDPGVTLQPAHGLTLQLEPRGDPA